MNQADSSRSERSKIQTDVLIINQCDNDEIKEFSFINKYNVKCKAKIVSTRARGLSNSRNMALDFSWGDYCVFCDDDEYFVDGYEQVIEEQFSNHPDFDLISFKLVYDRKQFKENEFKYNRFSITSVSSAQVVFNRAKVLSTGVKFDPLLGSGSGNGGGEESKFLFQLACKGLKGIYVPLLLARVNSNSKSLWFEGYTDQYIINMGWSYRRIYGTLYAYPLICYHAYRHRNEYNRTFTVIIKLLLKGFFENREITKNTTLI